MRGQTQLEFLPVGCSQQRTMPYVRLPTHLLDTLTTPPVSKDPVHHILSYPFHGFLYLRSLEECLPSDGILHLYYARIHSLHREATRRAISSRPSCHCGQALAISGPDDSSERRGRHYTLSAAILLADLLADNGLPCRRTATYSPVTMIFM